MIFNPLMVTKLCNEYSQALDSLLSGFSSLSLILNSTGIFTTGKQYVIFISSHKYRFSTDPLGSVSCILH